MHILVAHWLHAVCAGMAFVAKMGILVRIVGKRLLIAVGLDTGVKTATWIITESAVLTVVSALDMNSLNLKRAIFSSLGATFGFCAERSAKKRGGAKATPRYEAKSVACKACGLRMLIFGLYAC